MNNRRVFIGLGSNLGDAQDLFNRACDAFIEFSDVVAKSRLFTSKPYGYTDQPDFTNAVIEISTELKVDPLLECMQGIEKLLGKKVIRENGPRCIDLDMLYYGETIMETKVVTLPHPYAHERDFVLLPICDIAPDFIHPSMNKTMAQLLAAIETHYNTGDVREWLA